LGLGLILAAYLALALGYNLVTPVGLSPDELGHAYYIRYLVVNHRCPVLAKPSAHPAEWSYEAHQAPLYYFLAAPVWAAADAGTDNGKLHCAPWKPGSPIWMLTGPDAIRGRAVRLLSTLIGAVGLALLWALVGVLYPADGWLPLGVTALAAFLPMRLALAAAVSNDILLETLFTASLLAMAVLIRRGYTQRRAYALGAALGAAVLAKTTAVLLLPPALITLLIVSRHQVAGRAIGRLDGRLFFDGCLRAFGLALLIAGPWLLRNQLLYGDPLAARAFAAFFTATQPTPAATMAREGWTATDYLTRRAIPWTYSSFWGVFGPFTVWMAPAVYQGLRVPTLLAPLGLVLYFWRVRRVLEGEQRAVCLVLGLSLVLVAYGYVRYNLLVVEPQSRFLLAAIAPIALFAALGWLALVPPRARPAATLSLGVGMAALALYAMAGVIFPYYH
jgi:hypothetical protein